MRSSEEGQESWDEESVMGNKKEVACRRGGCQESCRDREEEKSRCTLGFLQRGIWSIN